MQFSVRRGKKKFASALMASSQTVHNSHRWFFRADESCGSIVLEEWNCRGKLHPFSVTLKLLHHLIVVEHLFTVLGINLSVQTLRKQERKYKERRGENYLLDFTVKKKEKKEQQAKKISTMMIMNIGKEEKMCRQAVKKVILKILIAFNALVGASMLLKWLPVVVDWLPLGIGWRGSELVKRSTEIF